MTISILSVWTVHISIVAKLAREIWTEYFVPIIGQSQVDYMLDKFQSERAIREQIDQGCEYFLIFSYDDVVGYFSLVPKPEEHTAQLSKIYVRKAERGHGAGKAAMEFAEKRCREAGINHIWLTVNKRNDSAIRFYERMGFVNAGSMATDIGGGFVMDDFQMKKALSPV